MRVYFDYNAPTYLGDMGAPNVGFNFHNYDNSDGDNSFLTPVRNAQGYQNSYNVPLLCSEFGGTNDTTVINTIADINDQNMLSAIFWAWFNNARFFFAENTNPVVMGVLQNMWGELAPPNLNQDMLTAVSRVYPRIIAGTPQNFGTDANDTFTFTYSTTKPNGQIGTDPTVIVVPAGLYPNDFTVTASGATWSRGDGTVLITPDSPTPASITVTIQPLSYPDRPRHRPISPHVGAAFGVAIKSVDGGSKSWQRGRVSGSMFSTCAHVVAGSGFVGVQFV